MCSTRTMPPWPRASCMRGATHYRGCATLRFPVHAAAPTAISGVQPVLLSNVFPRAARPSLASTHSVRSCSFPVRRRTSSAPAPSPTQSTLPVTGWRLTVLNYETATSSMPCAHYAWSPTRSPRSTERWTSVRSAQRNSDLSMKGSLSSTWTVPVGQSASALPPVPETSARPRVRTTPQTVWCSACSIARLNP